MPDRVKEKLVELLKTLPQVNHAEAYVHGMDYVFGCAADHLIANGVTVQCDKDINVPTKWISVKDRLPEYKGNYLGFTGSTIMVGYYKGNGIWWVWLNDTEGENLFTHWMPLPQPPKGE